MLSNILSVQNIFVTSYFDERNKAFRTVVQYFKFSWLLNFLFVKEEVFLTVFSSILISNNCLFNGREREQRTSRISNLFLIDFRERRREGERGRGTLIWERNIDWLPVLCTLTGTEPEPRQVPWRGIEPANFQFTGWQLNQLS